VSWHKSITGRTRAEVVVGERGDVVVKVYRNGQCVNDFSLPAEKDLGVHAELRRVGDAVEIWHDGPMGIKKLAGRYRDGVELLGAAPEEVLSGHN
jgi:hypothetical protein